MIAEPQNETYTYHLLSLEDKISLGCDSVSFNSRMEKRLDKIRSLKSGNDEITSRQNTSENTRH